MSKRLTDEERIVNWFRFAEPVAIQTMFNIVKGIMRSRIASMTQMTRKPKKAAAADLPIVGGSYKGSPIDKGYEGV